MPSPLPIARNTGGDIVLLPGMSNRHGLITAVNLSVGKYFVI